MPKGVRDPGAGQPPQTPRHEEAGSPEILRGVSDPGHDQARQGEGQPSSITEGLLGAAGSVADAAKAGAGRVIGTGRSGAGRVRDTGGSIWGAIQSLLGGRGKKAVRRPDKGAEESGSKITRGIRSALQGGDRGPEEPGRPDQAPDHGEMDLGRGPRRAQDDTRID